MIDCGLIVNRSWQRRLNIEVHRMPLFFSVFLCIHLVFRTIPEDNKKSIFKSEFKKISLS